MSRPLIFDEQLSRKPDYYPWTRAFIKAMHDNPWTESLFDFGPDVQSYKVEMTPEEQGLLVRTLSAVAQIEVAPKTYWAKLGQTLPHPSITDLGIVMGNIEVIHNMAYEKLLEELGIEEIFNENMKEDVLAKRVNYLRKYTHRYYKDSKKQFIYSLCLFTMFVEGVSLFSQFYILNWFLKFRNMLKVVVQQTNYTTREELVHTLAGVQIINTIREEYPELFDDELKEKIIEEANEALKAESKLAKWIIGDMPHHENLNHELITEYVKFRLNECLEMIGFGRPFEVNPDSHKKFFWFEEGVIGNKATDFFHLRPTEYSKNTLTEGSDDLFDD